MDNYISCVDEKNYGDYFQCIRNYVNSKNSFKGASYFIRTNSENSGTEAIQKNLIFYKIYGNSILGYPDLPENSHLVVSLKKENDIIEYIKDIGQRRQDIYFLDYYLRTKIPESILLRNSKNVEDIKKLIEARPYGFTTIEDIKKLKRSLDIKSTDNFYVPLSLSLPIVLNNQEYFPNIYYISKPYTIDTPYVFRILLGTSDFIKKPIKLFNDDLSLLSIIEFEKYSTIESYSLGLDYRFELDQKNLHKFEIQIKYDEFTHRFYDSIEKISELISILKFSPEDIGTYQIIRDNKKVKPIDIASGNRMAINPKGLNKITLDAIVGIAESIDNSPLLNHCIIKDNYVICDEKITKSDLPKRLIKNLNLDDILYTHYNTSNKKIDELFKHAKIKDTKLKDIITQHKEDEFEENREIVSKALELYLISHNN